MKTYLLGKLWCAQRKATDFVKNLVTNEEGDTNFVSIMLIILVVVALATIFRDSLTEMAENVFKGLTDFTVDPIATK